MSKSGKALGLPIVNVRAAGIDIGARIQVAAVPPDLSDDPVRTFGSFTADIEQMASWLTSIASRPSRWSPPACIGFRSTRSWKRMA